MDDINYSKVEQIHEILSDLLQEAQKNHDEELEMLLVIVDAAMKVLDNYYQ